MIRPWGELALRYFRTFDMFSEHCDDNRELAAMYYFAYPRKQENSGIPARGSRTGVLRPGMR